jgi:hypothetical protein
VDIKGISFMYNALVGVPANVGSHLSFLSLAQTPARAVRAGSIRLSPKTVGEEEREWVAAGPAASS